MKSLTGVYVDAHGERVRIIGHGGSFCIESEPFERAGTNCGFSYDEVEQVVTHLEKLDDDPYNPRPSIGKNQNKSCKRAMKDVRKICFKSLFRTFFDGSEGLEPCYRVMGKAVESCAR